MFKDKNGYVPRNERYNNLLDTAYADIVEKRKAATTAGIKDGKKRDDGMSQNMRLASDPATHDAIKTPTVSKHQHLAVVNHRTLQH